MICLCAPVKQLNNTLLWTVSQIRLPDHGTDLVKNSLFCFPCIIFNVDQFPSPHNCPSTIQRLVWGPGAYVASGCVHQHSRRDERCQPAALVWGSSKPPIHALDHKAASTYYHICP